MEKTLEERVAALEEKLKEHDECLRIQIEINSKMVQNTDRLAKLVTKIILKLS